MHIHHSQTSASSLHSKRHGPIPAIPNRPLLPSGTQHPFPVIPNTAPSSLRHSERSATPLPCHSEHSEESKLIAHTPFTDLSFLPSLEMTLDSTQPQTKQLIRNLLLRNSSYKFLEWQQAVVYHIYTPQSVLKDYQSERSAAPLLSFRTQ